MIDVCAFIRAPLNFKNKFNIYPPSVREVVTNQWFNSYHSLLCTTEDDIKEQYKKDGQELEKYPSPFEFLLISCYHYPEIKIATLKAFEFFCHVNIDFSFENKQIIIYNDDSKEVAWLSEDEYFDFQNMIREAIGEKKISPPLVDNPEEDPRIRRIKERARERDRIKAKQKNKDGISFSTCLTAICCMGIGITPLNIGEMSYAAVGPIMHLMQDKERYDIDVRSLLAGADSKKVKPKYWIRNSNE